MFDYNLNDSRFVDGFEDLVKQQNIKNLIRISENPNLPKDIVKEATNRLRGEFGLKIPPSQA